MFDFIKQAAQLKSIHEQMKKARQTCAKNGVSVTVNGSFMAESIELDPTRPANTQEADVRDCFNEAVAAIQKSLAAQFGQHM